MVLSHYKQNKPGVLSPSSDGKFMKLNWQWQLPTVGETA
ncbi:hypothetical protein GPB2148_1542 [marine gamma proteobacterium HTCC2148]|nr:hypothetical protein GPB2148_1542 [marine gamma proteobacterium HTCC2148]